MSKVVPLGEYVLIEMLLEETLTASGIMLPDTGKDKPGSGKVLAVGPGKVGDNGTIVPISDVAIGDIVFFAKYSPEEVEVDGKKFLLIRHSSIFAKQSV